MIQVEVKKKCYWNYCLCPSNGHRWQIQPDPNHCHYPLMTYLSQNNIKNLLFLPGSSFLQYHKGCESKAVKKCKCKFRQIDFEFFGYLRYRGQLKNFGVFKATLFLGIELRKSARKSILAKYVVCSYTYIHSYICTQSWLEAQNFPNCTSNLRSKYWTLFLISALSMFSTPELKN